MRLQRITNVAPRYLAKFYAERPELAAEGFETQRAALMADCFGWADFWSVALTKLGYEADEVVANVEPMQKRWARDHGFAFDESNWRLEIAAAQVKAFRPNVLFVVDHHNFPAPFLRQLKAECPSIQLVLGWCGAPYNDPAVFRECDLVLSCIPELVEHFRQGGHLAHHLNHAFDPRILGRIDCEAQPTADFAFIGSIVKLDRFHQQREQLLRELVRKTDLQLWTESYRPSWQQMGSAFLRRSAYDAVQKSTQSIGGLLGPLVRATPLVRRVAGWEARPPLPQATDQLLSRRAHPPLYGVAMFQQLHDSRVALNTHIDISPASASNMRLFEATGVGTCLLTDWKANQRELFEPDAEMVSYRSSEECIEKVRYLLDHEDERRRIALAGQRRTLRSHTFAERAEQLDALVRRALEG
ncbi:MAG TPA: glycosyltransferase [Pyrinomonadaceae bacterium]